MPAFTSLPLVWLAETWPHGHVVLKACPNTRSGSIAAENERFSVKLYTTAFRCRFIWS
ncbi:hypothetical protein [Serratia fonticola]|uniref:hypothetical protein n=1 Tax=Serratia fonticola TaxID=47917 RepID=UPI0034C5DB09